MSIGSGASDFVKSPFVVVVAAVNDVVVSVSFLTGAATTFVDTVVAAKGISLVSVAVLFTIEVDELSSVLAVGVELVGRAGVGDCVASETFCSCVLTGVLTGLPLLIEVGRAVVVRVDMASRGF